MPEQWIFWIATNLFSIYLWWGHGSIRIVVCLLFTVNSIVGMYRWIQQAKANQPRRDFMPNLGPLRKALLRD